MTTPKPAENLETALNRLKTLAKSTIIVEGQEEPQPVKITIEKCGTWLWIGGDTYPVRKELKNIGCRWSPTKSRWYWKHPKEKFTSHGKVSMPKIRYKYGSEFIETEETQPQ